MLNLLRKLIYERDGASCIPFFSSQDYCQTFCCEYMKRAENEFKRRSLF